MGAELGAAGEGVGGIGFAELASIASAWTDPAVAAIWWVPAVVAAVEIVVACWEGAGGGAVAPMLGVVAETVPSLEIGIEPAPVLPVPILATAWSS